MTQAPEQHTSRRLDQSTVGPARRRSSPATRRPGRRCSRCCTWCSRSRATSARTGIRFCAEQLDLSDGRGHRGRDVLHDVQAHARAASTWSASAPTRCARRSAATRSTRALKRPPRCRPRGDRGRAGHAGFDHAGARRVPRGVRPRPGAAGQLRVLRQPDAGRGALGLVEALQRGEKPAPTRGAPLTDFSRPSSSSPGSSRTATRDLDGPSAAPETLRGAQLAEDRGWDAPTMPSNAEFPPLPEKK